MKTTSRPPYVSFGFTLVEISVVMAVIALVIGAIVVGKHMMETAAINGTMSRIKEVQVAVGMFRERYGSLPGDYKKANDTWPSKFALNGNGDGKITGGYDGSNGNLHDSTSFECYNAWHHLYLSGLYPQYFAPVSASPSGTATNLGPKLPLDGAYLSMRYDDAYVVGSTPGLYFLIAGISNCMNGPGFKAVLLGTPPVVMNDIIPPPSLFSLLISDAWAAGLDIGISPKIAYLMDEKFDDGIANRGKFLFMPGDVGDPGKECTIPGIDTKLVYNTDSDKLVCGLWISHGL